MPSERISLKPKSATPSPSKKRILISFISFDHDDFNRKRKKDPDPKKDRENASDFIKSFKLKGGSLPQKPNEIWRPSIALAQLYDLDRKDRQPDLIFDDYYLLYSSREGDPKANYRKNLADQLAKEIRQLQKSSPTKTNLFVENLSSIKSAYDYREVYQGLLAFAKRREFHAEGVECYINCANGTTPIRNCLFLLMLTGRFGNAKQISVSAWEHYWDKTCRTIKGSYSITNPNDFLNAVKDINDTTEDQIEEALSKGVFTKDSTLFGSLRSVIKSLKPLSPTARRRLPILLTGPTGVGKTHLAKNIKDALLNQEKTVPFHAINCATISGADTNIARAELFGSVKDAYTGATDRDGLLKKADTGVLFMDEIGELPLDMQSMLLTALDTGKFSPIGAPEKSETSNFFLIAGTNRDLDEMVERGQFRRDLLNRINTWHFKLKSLKDLLKTREDAQENYEREFAQIKKSLNLSKSLTFSDEARKLLLDYIMDPQTLWSGNFREFNSLLLRIALLANAQDEGVMNVPIDIVEGQIKEARERQKSLIEIRQKVQAEHEGSPMAVHVPVVPPAPENPPSDETPPPRSIVDDLDAQQRQQISPLERAQITFIENICHSQKPRTLKALAQAVYGDTCKAKDGGVSTIRNRLQGWGLSFNKGEIELLGKEAPQGD